MRKFLKIIAFLIFGSLTACTLKYPIEEEITVSEYRRFYSEFVNEFSKENSVKIKKQNNYSFNQTTVLITNSFPTSQYILEDNENFRSSTIKNTEIIVNKSYMHTTSTTTLSIVDANSNLEKRQLSKNTTEEWVYLDKNNSYKVTATKCIEEDFENTSNNKNSKTFNEEECTENSFLNLIETESNLISYERISPVSLYVDVDNTTSSLATIEIKNNNNRYYSKNSGSLRVTIDAILSEDFSGLMQINSIINGEAKFEDYIFKSYILQGTNTYTGIQERNEKETVNIVANYNNVSENYPDLSEYSKVNNK